MIDWVRIYWKSKIHYESYVAEEKKIYEVKRHLDLEKNHLTKHFKSSVKGINIEIDHYKAFITGMSKIIHNNLNNENILSASQNLTFTDLALTIQVLLDHMTNIDQSNVSQIQIGFSVPTNIPGKEIIRTNLLMHKSKYYNTDIGKKNSKEFKKFTYRNYSIELNAEKKDQNRLNYINVSVKFKKNKELRPCGLQNVKDLLKQEVIKELFSVFMSRFNQLIIIDAIQDYNIFREKDKRLMKDFMGNAYWYDLPNKIARQNVWRKKKKFLSLIEEYNLNTIKKDLVEKLKTEFNIFINN